MIPRSVRDITPADLQELIETPVREGKAIEYKRQLPGAKDEDKREFLADISSFANASGGDLMFGVQEEDGAPTKLIGVEAATLDSEIQRLESLLRSGLEPRLPHYDIAAIDLGGNRSVLVLRVAQSWSAPHRVTFRDHSKFYGRNSAGKYPLDVGKLRLAFTASEALGERIRRFREDRLAKVVAQETPVPLVGNLPSVVLHTVPLRAFTTRQTVDLVDRDRVTALVYPMYATSMTHQINLEGIVGHEASGQETHKEYNQLFRSGIVESVLVLDVDDMRRISLSYEHPIIEKLRRSLGFLAQSDVLPPAYIFLSLLGFKGTRPSPTYALTTYANRPPLNHKDLILPDIVVEDFSSDPATILRPLFDTVWNAYGYERSFNYDKDGNWTGNATRR